MTETTTAKATIDTSYIIDAKGLGDTISHAIGDKSMSLTIHSSDKPADGLDKTADIEVKGMTSPELAAILKGLGFRLVEASTPVAASTESADIAKMPTPTLNENKWNMGECVDWLEAVVATATDKTKTYREAVQQLIENIEIADEYTKKLPPNQIISSFHATFAGEICHREPHGVELWKHKHGIELPETNHHVEKATAIKPTKAAEKCPEGYFKWVVHTSYGSRQSFAKGQETWTKYIEIRDPARLDENKRLKEGESGVELTEAFLASKGISIKTVKAGQTVFVKYDEARYLDLGGTFSGMPVPPKLQTFMIEDIRLG